MAPSVGFQMDVLGQDGSDGLHEQDLHDDVFAPADVVMRSPRVAE